MNIWLIGMMGSGKTTVGRLLAGERDMEFRDVDSIISTRVAGTVSELWQWTGEEGFRALEADVVEELAAGAGAVIASGGGAVLAEANRQAMRRSGTVVWLQASADALAARLVGANDRPLLADDGTAPLAMGPGPGAATRDSPARPRPGCRGARGVASPAASGPGLPSGSPRRRGGGGRGSRSRCRCPG